MLRANYSSLTTVGVLVGVVFLIAAVSEGALAAVVTGGLEGLAHRSQAESTLREAAAPFVSRRNAGRSRTRPVSRRHSWHQGPRRGTSIRQTTTGPAAGRPMITSRAQEGLRHGVDFRAGESGDPGGQRL